jgi:hypothetical protein
LFFTVYEILIYMIMILDGKPEEDPACNILVSAKDVLLRLTPAIRCGAPPFHSGASSALSSALILELIFARYFGTMRTSSEDMRIVA